MLLTLLLGCDTGEPTADPLPLTPCHITGLDAESLCGTLAVPEDPAAPDGETCLLYTSPSPRDDR